MARVLIVCADRVGLSMAGPAIRCWEMARVLTAAGHDVHLSVPAASDRDPAGFEVVPGDDRTLAAEEAWAGVLVVQGLVMSNHPVLAGTQKHLVVDLYDPFVLETLEMYSQRPLEEQVREHWPSLAALLVQLRIGDFFICANQRQRDFWIGCLLAADRVNPHTFGQDRLLRRLIDVAPFGLSQQDPAHSGIPAARGVLPGIPQDALLAVWAGGIYNWFDSLSLVRAWPEVMRRVPRARLLFLGVRHPNPVVPEMEMATRTVRLAEELELRDRGVSFNMGWVPYERRQDFLLEADLGVSMHFDHLETRLSFRTRFLDYIWASLPMVATEGDAFAEWIAGQGTGAVVPYEDSAAIAGSIATLLGDESRRTADADRVRALRAGFTWERALAPLVRYCAEPWRAADLAGGRNATAAGHGALAGDLQPPPGLVARALWFRRREGSLRLGRRAVRKARRFIVARIPRRRANQQ